MDRRDFLKTVGLGALATGLPLSVEAAELHTDAIPRRPLGNTGMSVPILGLGCSHLRLHKATEATDFVRRCLDAGITYFDTAASYGDSEEKLGAALDGRRDGCWIATKTAERSADAARKQLEESLRRLRTDHVDEWRMHKVDTLEELGRILAHDGALAAAKRAQSEGLIRHVSISGHNPAVMLEALQRHPFRTALVPVNYLDCCNFPTILRDLLPYAHEHGIGIVAMKPLGRGLLKAHEREALRWTLTQPIACTVVGMHTPEMIAAKLDVVRGFKPMTSEELQAWRRDAPELGPVICRTCGHCLPCPAGINIPAIFECEGWLDRQLGHPSAQYRMDTKDVADLKGYFGLAEAARAKYAALSPNASACAHCGQCAKRCPYGLDVPEKLAQAHKRLTA